MTNGLTKYASDWFSRGDDDLALVELVLEKKTGSANLACFHLQQAAKKYLKGFLAHRDLHVRKIHDLETLLEDCKIVDADFVQLQDDMRLLNRFYTESRYPDDYIEFNWQDVESAYAAILRIKEFVMQKIQPSKTSGGFGLIGIIIALAVVVLAGGGGWYYFNRQLTTDNQQQTTDDKSVEETEQNPQVVINEPTIDTSDWKTYRNEQYGFEFKYPKEWKMDTPERQSNMTDIPMRDGKPTYFYNGESCGISLSFGAYDNTAVFYKDNYENYPIYNSDKTGKRGSGDEITIYLGDFSKRPDIIFDGLGEEEINVFDVEKVIKGRNSRASDYYKIFVRKSLDNHWAFYDDRYYKYGGPCTIHPSLIQKLNFAQYDFLEEGKYIAFLVSTSENEKELFNQILSTFKFIK